MHIFHTFLMPNYEWIEKLAKEEVSAQESGEFSLYSTFDNNTILKDQTTSLLIELRQTAQEMTNTFNAFRGEKNTIKVFHISGSEADFMLFRNNLKLLFSQRKPGEIVINFLSVRNGLVEEKKNQNSETQGDSLKASIGPFNEAIWFFREHNIEPRTLMRYYFTEFVKNSLL